MKKNILALCTTIFALILEMTPYGAVLYFGMPDRDPVRKTFSYFSLVPYGYAVFFPLLTAILTVLLIVFLILSFIKKSEKIKNTAFYLSFVGTIFSLLPLVYGIRYFSLVGAGISLFLGITSVFLFRKESLK